MGNNVRLSSLELRLKAVIHTSQSSTNVRFLVVLDKQGYNAPTIADILEPAYLGSTYTSVGLYNWDYSHRFKILLDKVFTLTQGAFQAQFLDVMIPLNCTSYNIGASTTFSNHAYIIVISTESNVLQLPVYFYTSRLRYTDE